MKYHLTRRWVLRADFRETLSAQPDWWTPSQKALEEIQLNPGEQIKTQPVIKYGVLRQ